MTGTDEITSAATAGSYDPWTTTLTRDETFEFYRTLRDAGPVVYSTAHGGYWLVPRYADVKEAARNYRAFTSELGISIGTRGPLQPRSAPIEYDPPAHRPFRNAMIAPFTPARIDELRPLVMRHLTAAVDYAVAAGSFDIFDDIAAPLATGVISEILGFDEAARVRNRELALAVVLAKYEAQREASTRYIAFLEDEVRRRVDTEMDGWLGQLVTRSLHDGTFDVDELISITRAMALAGHHTTINGSASMLMYLADPAIRTRWLSEPSEAAITGFVEESLRIEPPIHLEGRWTTREVDVDGVRLPADVQVALLFGSANHDERIFDRPNEFDPTRRVGHLAFGHGVHTCLGMGLARLEMTLLLEEAVKRLPQLRLDGEPVESGMVFGHHMGWNAMPARA
jgi:cytochrome P450